MAGNRSASTGRRDLIGPTTPVVSLGNTAANLVIPPSTGYSIRMGASPIPTCGRAPGALSTFMATNAPPSRTSGTVGGGDEVVPEDPEVVVVELIWEVEVVDGVATGPGSLAESDPTKLKTRLTTRAIPRNREAVRHGSETITSLIRSTTAQHGSHRFELARTERQPDKRSFRSETLVPSPPTKANSGFQPRQTGLPRLLQRSLDDCQV